MADEHKPGIGILKVLPVREPDVPVPCVPLIAMFEDLLAKAKTGELLSAVVLAKSGSSYNYDFAGIECVSHMMGYNTVCDIVKSHLLGVILDNSD